MSRVNHHITVFEHESIRFDKGEKRITENQFNALQHYYGNGVPYYNLSYNGVQFNEYVGVIQIGNTLIEVLPKTDKYDTDDTKWRNILIGMLKAVGSFDIKSTSHSTLKIRPNTILDLYFEMFIKEVEYLLHNGLIKQYRKKEGNVTVLKGCLRFGKHIQHNLTHQERFFICYNTYDLNHLLHFILYKTMCLLKQINTNVALHSRIGALLLHFPEMPDIKVTESTFDKLNFNRKTYIYKKAINISKHILLQYHPDVRKGKNHVLALMFDMNKLWEQFVYVSLKKNVQKSATVNAQCSKYFWKPDQGYRTTIRPDIVINKDKDNCAVLDTKWKKLIYGNPSPEDLRQLYVYQEYFKANKAALVYPGIESKEYKGVFYSASEAVESKKECSVIFLSLPNDSNGNKNIVKTWQEDIHKRFEKWLE